MSLSQVTLASAFVLLSVFATACSEEMRIQDVESGSYQYWCLVSHGTWDEHKGPCLCNGAPCALGAVCIKSDTGLTCSSKGTQNKPDDNSSNEAAEQEQ